MACCFPNEIEDGGLILVCIGTALRNSKELRPGVSRLKKMPEAAERRTAFNDLYISRSREYSRKAIAERSSSRLVWSTSKNFVITKHAMPQHLKNGALLTVH